MHKEHNNCCFVEKDHSCVCATGFDSNDVARKINNHATTLFTTQVHPTGHWNTGRHHRGGRSYSTGSCCFCIPHLLLWKELDKKAGVLRTAPASPQKVKKKVDGREISVFECWQGILLFLFGFPKTFACRTERMNPSLHPT